MIGGRERLMVGGSLPGQRTDILAQLRGAEVIVPPGSRGTWRLRRLWRHRPARTNTSLIDVQDRRSLLAGDLPGGCTTSVGPAQPPTCFGSARDFVRARCPGLWEGPASRTVASTSL